MSFNIEQKKQENEALRVVAFGSSNTQRYTTGMHWFDYVEMAYKNVRNKAGLFINSGISGNTTDDLLERFDRELVLLQPHLVIITIGGNDCNPLKNVPLDKYKDNLRELHRKITALGTDIIFQTYYACDLERLRGDQPQRAEDVLEYMQAIRDMAAELDCPLIDHYARWQKLLEHDVKVYRSMMKDPLHVNALGNMVLGLDIIDFFGLKLGAERIEEHEKYCNEGLIIKSYLDKLAE
ncbi:MAG: SGNH/GDSL hydrolase family protein [Lentisphaerae bacterium]|nr:SGNH/GDSL hydrolase family protein [Lentisphaerota bacterium]MCP4100893.1 SGNH/GDSL hydrolase family protein [Lentisphaerota bacterium]